MLMLRKKHTQCLGGMKDFDLFGTDIKFFYKGREVYTTVCGSIVTLLAMVAYLTLVGIKMNEFFGMTDPDQYFTETYQSLQEPIELTELGFSFAIENIPVSLDAIVELHQVEWDGLSGVKIETQISLEACESFSP